MTAIGFLLLQVAPPQDGDNAWVWVAGVMAVALGVLFTRYELSRSAQIKREQDLNDKLTAAFPELLALMRDWKDAQRDRTNTGRS